jgi:prepilin-type N-terminal cleavage/methylation domain-containing protein
MSRLRSGFSLIELLIVVAILIVILTVAIPYYQGAVMSSQEMAAMQAIRTLQAAEAQYYSQNGKYAASLSELTPRWIAGDLAAGEKGGYRFRVGEDSAAYAIHAEPVKFGRTGSRTFYSDEAMIIRENRGPEPATASSPEAR